ncbi:unnamed protein product [marine sediment metagenome]|uniref:Uncharacterized protein n=2 Tax=marine sediment metagenome TaxID=412755 RepID=X1R5J7_9ZZZZ
MVMQRLREEETPEQPLPLVRVCWDELFDFLRKLFKPKASKAWTAFGNLDAETSTNYKKVFEAIVPDSFEGRLNEISLYSSRPDTTQWVLTIVEEVQFVDKRIYQSLTLPYGGMSIATLQKITVGAKTDGTATNIAATLTGELTYLGK